MGFSSGSRSSSKKTAKSEQKVLTALPRRRSRSIAGAEETVEASYITIVGHQTTSGAPAKVPARRTANPDFRALYQMEPIDRVRILRVGIAPKSFHNIADAMGRSKESFGTLVGVAPSTIERKLKSGRGLTVDQGEPLMEAAKLIGQIEAMVEASGDPEGFDAARWFNEWLNKPLNALGGQTPAELMDTAEGRSLVSRLLATAQSGAYA